MADLANTLLASLQPATRSQAEKDLEKASLSQPSFFVQLLRIVLDPAQSIAARQAASIYFKNSLKRRWDTETTDTPISDAEKQELRADLLPAMITLKGSANKQLRAQLAESIAIVAACDFPQRWDTLIDQLVSALSPVDYATNLSVLETAHSIFMRWRSASREDTLYATINFVLSRFLQPFIAVFRETAAKLLTRPPTSKDELAVVAQTQAVLLSLFYDLTCQDLPPGLDKEGAQAEFFGGGANQQGWFMSFLAWDPESLRVDLDETTPSIPSRIKTVILEIAELYVNRYSDELEGTNVVETLVRTVWELTSGGKNVGLADDAMIAQALRFLSVTIKNPSYKQIFSSKEVIATLIEGVIVPNVALREHVVEIFEDDPLEYIRQDLALPGATAGDVATRRHAAAEVLRALVAGGWEVEATEVASTWVQRGLQEAASNPAEKWQSKDASLFLFTALATRGSTGQQGVTSTNPLVDVVGFFGSKVFPDMQADSGTVNPVIQADSIRFLHSFRNQLTKEQLLSVLPLLVRHLNGNNYVCYSYAAITIERILFIKKGNLLLFAQADIHDFAVNLLDATLKKVESASSPQKMAENDFLMKCAMRIILTGRQTFVPTFAPVLQRLVNILGVMCSNPSNPLFDQYLFESISGLMRFIVSANPSTLGQFEDALFGPFGQIIQADIEQYVPYVFQLLAQMIELSPGTLSEKYHTILPILLAPPAWQQKGSIPGLVRLLRDFLEKDTQAMISGGSLQPVLGVLQSTLMPSRVNDVWGFELLQAVVRFVPRAALQQYLAPIFLMLLKRLQSLKTDGFTYSFVYFVLYMAALNVNDLSLDVMIDTVEGIQSGLWGNLFSSVILPEVPKTRPNHRKLAAVGLTRILTRSPRMVREPLVQFWPTAFTTLVKIFQDPQLLQRSQRGEEVAEEIVDLEEQAAGYQAAYSRLAASERPPEDPVAYVEEPANFLIQELQQLRTRETGIDVNGLMRRSDPEVTRAVIGSLG